MNFPKEWVDALVGTTAVYNPKHGSAPVYNSRMDAVNILSTLRDVGALKEIPEPRTILFCEKHDGYIYVSSDTDAKMLFCSKHDGHICILKKYREVLE